MGDDSTILIKDINEALKASEQEALDRAAGLLAIGGGINGMVFDLYPGKITLGRNPENDIPLEQPGISRQHVSLRIEEEADGELKVYVSDLQSKNGTFINDQKIADEILLAKGDILKVGSVALKYLPKGDPERATIDKLNKTAVTDALTGCFNKAFYYSNSEKLFMQCRKVGMPLSLVIFDLDHFKKLNDSYGHDAGDYVLKDFAQLVQNQGLRKGDIFARYGGEEFILLLPDTNLKTAYNIGERIRQLIEDHKFTYQDQRIQVTASIGISDYRPGVKSREDLFKRADLALYKSKEGGRNQVNFYRE